jgi:hypothetical protein
MAASRVDEMRAETNATEEKRDAELAGLRLENAQLIQRVEQIEASLAMQRMAARILERFGE